MWWIYNYVMNWRKCDQGIGALAIKWGCEEGGKCSIYYMTSGTYRIIIHVGMQVK
jgi:hypothetical protein